MASVKIYTDKIRNARYGKEVRSSIADSIDIINEESEASVKKVNQAEANVNKAVTDATNATNAANTAASSATTAVNNANEAAQAIFNEKYILTARTEFVKSTSVSPTAKGNAILEKLRGDSWQKQLGGKNLYNVNDKHTFDSAVSTDKEGWISFAYDNTNGTGIKYLYACTNISPLLTISTDYAVVLEVESISNGAVVEVGHTSNYLKGQFKSNADSNAVGILVKTLTTRDSFDDCTSMAKTIMGIPAGVSASGKFRISILEDTTVTKDTFVYEEFCGGTISPNPEFKQDLRSIGDRGWFDGEFKNGGYGTQGEFYDQGDRVSNKNYIPCNPNDVICIKSKDLTGVHIAFFNENNFVTRQVLDNEEGVYEFTAPSGVNRFHFNCVNSSGLRVNTVGHVCVTINGKYALIVDEVGKNKFDIFKALVGGFNSDGDYVIGHTENKFYEYNWKENVQYTFSAYVKNVILDGVSSVGNVRFNVKYDDGTEDYNALTNKSTEYKYCTFTSKAGKTISSLNITYGSVGKMYIKGGELQIEEDVVATTYTPHQSKRTYIPLTEPLRAIGDIKDEICIQDGKYGVLRRIKEVIFDASNDERWRANTKASEITYFYITIEEYGKVISECVACSHFQSVVVSNNTTDTVGICVVNSNAGNDSRVLIRPSIPIGTLEEFTTWLKANPITAQHGLTTPTFTPFENQTPFYELMAYDEVTHVSIAGCHEELNPIATMRFPRNEDGAMVTTNWCDNKKNEIRMNELTAALLALGRE